MVRIKQFADDLAISTKKAKDLINKGRNRRDGGSQILESVMSDTDKKKKKKKKQLKPDIGRRGPVMKKEDLKDGFRTTEYRKEMDNPDLSGMKPDLYSKGGSNVTTMNTDKLSKAQLAQFTNIKNDAVNGKISPEEAQKMIRKMLLIKRKDGGGFPDLTGDGKVTKKDILKGRGVPGFSRGGGIAIQGLGFKGVR
tara:strand:+ start:57 stop:641 length:585 start_codon:yes stop_codon:yes gene_type:complete